MKLKKISWALRRHPLLYYARFWLLSKNSSLDGIESESYNDFNPKDKIPKHFYAINDKIFSDSSSGTDLDKAKQIAIWLRENIRGGRGLSLASDEALKEMIAGNGGVCSDMSQIFNNFCVINDIKVREWGITIIPFDKKFGGHATNEIYCSDLGKWIMMDVSKSILFYLPNDSVPLSLKEVFTSKLKHTYSPFYGNIKNDIQIKNYYFNSKATPFLISRYNNNLYDKFLRKNNARLPIFFIHFYIYLIGKSYKYKFPLRDYRAMFKSK